MVFYMNVKHDPFCKFHSMFEAFDFALRFAMTSRLSWCPVPQYGNMGKPSNYPIDRNECFVAPSCVRPKCTYLGNLPLSNLVFLYWAHNGQPKIWKTRKKCICFPMNSVKLTVFKTRLSLIIYFHTDDKPIYASNRRRTKSFLSPTR